MDGRTLDFVALGIFITVLITLLYAIIYIHDIPYEIAKKRNHPHQDALHTAGWVSLFLMHAIWPFLWIWATLYKPERGWGMVPDGMLLDDSEKKAGIQETLLQDESLQDEPSRELVALRAKVSALQELVDLKAKLAALEKELEPAQGQKPESPAEEA